MLKEAFILLYSSSIVLCIPWTIHLSLFSNVSEEEMEKGESEPCHLISECYTLQKESSFCFEHTLLTLMPGVNVQIKRFLPCRDFPKCLLYSLTRGIINSFFNPNDLLLPLMGWKMGLLIKDQPPARADGKEVGGRVIKCGMLGMGTRNAPLRNRRLQGQTANKAEIL